MGSSYATTRWKRMGYGKRPGQSSRARGEAGFTLVELLLALFLFALIASVIFAAFAAVARGADRAWSSIVSDVRRCCVWHRRSALPCRRRWGEATAACVARRAQEGV